MKKLLVFIMLFIVSVFMFACKKEDKIGLDYVKDKGELVVGFTDFPPFGYMQNGEYLGFDLEVAKLVCEKLGVKFKAQYIDWDAQVMEINSKKVDCIWNAMTITEARKENMIFSKPYFETELVVLTVKDSTKVTSVDDLTKDGVKIGVESNGTADINLSEDDKYTIEKYLTVSNALFALEAGNIDAIVVDKTYANDYVMKQSAAQEKYQIIDGTVGEKEEYGIAFRKEDVDLKDAVDKAFDELVQEGKIAPIVSKYFGESNGFKR